MRKPLRAARYDRPVRIAIVGSGGVGGLYGARLLAAGEEVTFLARGAHAEALRSEGLLVRSERGDLHLRPVRVATSLGEVGVVDFALVTVKLWDTEAVAAELPA